jgi:N-acetylmuramoyl-L-alanine amidase
VLDWSEVNRGKENQMKKVLYVHCLVVLLSWYGVSQASWTVVLDPGHGGVYNNAVSVSGLLEKHEVLKITKEVARLLESKGITVVLTRNDDIALDDKDLIEDLKKRAAVIEKCNGDIFVSIHLNLDPDVNISGYELYVPYADTLPIESYKLAASLHYSLSHKIGPEFGGGNLGNLNKIDRGIRAARFNVLVRATRPAVLVELGFLSHVPTAEALEKGEFGPLCAEAVCEGIITYVREVAVRSDRVVALHQE